MSTPGPDGQADRTEPRVLFRNTMKVTPGHQAEFRQAILDAAAFAEERAPQILVDVSIDEEHGTATSFQLYPSSEAVLRHWELSDPSIAKVMEHCTVDRFEVFGAPSDEVRAGFGQLSGVDVTFHPRLTGDLRLDGAAPARRA